MMIPWWEHSEKGVTGRERQTDGQTDRQRQRDRQKNRQKDRQYLLKGKSIWKCYLQNVDHFSGLNIGLFIFFQGASATKAKKRNSAYFKISGQNHASVKTKKYLIHSQLHPKWKSRLCSTILWFHIKPLHNVCANQVHQFAICTICIIYYTKIS